MVNQFPFGQRLKKVEQTDKSPKKVFVLGVYASAVHAKWLDTNSRMKVRAMAVASEPYIFWKGDGAEEIISNIPIPKQIGSLILAEERFNGPSGIALDELYLKPIGCARQDAWLCDIIPCTRLNQNQWKAIENDYNPLVAKYDLPECTIPKYRVSELNNANRRIEILQELKQSKSRTIILLGDLPIRWFLRFFIEENYTKLSDFGMEARKYGQPHKIDIDGQQYEVLPLVHPRQASGLGMSNDKWTDLHSHWVNVLKNKL